MWKLNPNDNDETERHSIEENDDGSYSVDNEGKYESLEDAIRKISQF